MPLAPPVTIATLPSSLPAISLLVISDGGRRSSLAEFRELVTS
jgi:hypothetical protein